MKSIIFISIAIIAFSCSQPNHERNSIGDGEMPNITRDQSGNIHVVYGDGQKILYAVSTNEGKSFSSPIVVSSLPGLAASHMRGPQIAATSKGLIITACTEQGNIYSFIQESANKWVPSARVNDVDTIAKENLMSLSADGELAFAIWQDLRGGQNAIYGSRSMDGGRTWERNKLIYASPDGSVCECCKPTVLVRGNDVHILFRNSLDGNRDMYLIESSDGGNSFGQAQKLGTGSWALKGCPMDGGNIVLTSAGTIETVWRRKNMVYAAEKNKQEQEIGEGKSCTLETVNNKNVYAWIDGENVIVMKPHGMKKNLGPGSMPVLKALNNEHVLCVWEDDRRIYSEVVAL